MRNLKKVLSLALALVMLIGMMVIGAGAVDATEYPDYGEVSADKQEAVQVITALSVIDGTEKGLEPEANLTRAQAAVIVTRALLGRNVADALSSSTCVFTDVPDWAMGAVQYCADLGIVNGIGNNLFAPNSPVKGTEFAAMLLRAVDPDGDYVGEGWANKVIVAGNKNGLSKSIPITSAALTREGAAQMAFNTITDYSPSGATSWSVDGKSFDSFIEAYLYADKLGKVSEISKTAANDSLAATVFNLSSSSKTDAFGRPTVVWNYDGDDVVTVPGTTAALTFTKKIAASALDGYTYASDAKLVVDGKDGVALSGDDAVVAASNNGTLVEVYASDKVISKVVAINEKFGTVTTVTAAKDDAKRTVTVTGGKKFETEDFAKGDKVIYTVAGKDENIQTMELATLVENVQVTRKTGTTKFTADGTEYEYAQIAANKNKIVVNNWVDLYLDSYNYMVSAEENEGEQFYAAVIGVGSNNPYGDSAGGCTLLLTDGTTVSANYRLKSGSLGSQKVHNSSNVAIDGWPADIVKYRVLDDGTYELRVVGAQDQTYDDADNEIQFINGKSEFILDDGADGSSTPDVNLYTTSNTVFMVATKDGANGRITYKVYTGYNAAPSIDAGETNHSVAIAKTNNRIDVVYLAYDKMSGVTSVDTFVAVPNEKNVISDSTGDYYELPAVVEGEVTTVKVDSARADAILTTAGVYALSGVVKDSDDMITDFANGNTAAFTTNGTSGTGVVAADGKVLGIGASEGSAAYWAYNDNTLAYYVNKNYTSITALDVEDIVTDNNDKVFATLDTGNAKKTLKDVFVVEQDAPTTTTYTLPAVAGVQWKVGSADFTAVNTASSAASGVTITIKLTDTTKTPVLTPAQSLTDGTAGDGMWTFTMPAANITKVELKDADAYAGKVEFNLTDKTDVTLLYKGTKPTFEQTIALLTSKLTEMGYTKLESGSGFNSGVGNEVIAIDATKSIGGMDVKDTYTLTYKTDAKLVEAVEITIDRTPYLIAKTGNLNNFTGYSKATHGTCFVDATKENPTASDYVVAASTTVASLDGKSYNTGYVKVTGDGIASADYASMGSDYTVPAKTAVTSAKGTGFTYAVGSGTAEYVAYAGKIAKAELTDDVVLTGGFVKVTVTVVTGQAPTGTFSVALGTDGGSTPLTAAGESYAKSTANDFKVTGTGTDVYVKTTGLTTDLDGTAAVTTGTEQTVGDVDVTVTVQKTAHS